MARIEVNQYTHTYIGHVNVTAYDDSNNVIGTWGSNVTGSGGVFEETWHKDNLSESVIANIYVDSTTANNISSHAQSMAYQTSIGNGYYFLLGANCVDFAQDILNMINPALRVGDYALPNTLVNTYADTATWLRSDYWYNREIILSSEDSAMWQNIKDTEAFTDQVSARQIGDLEAIYTDYDTNSVLSPIAIDLNGDGIQTIGLSESDVSFDLAADGYDRNVGWLSSDDAFLVVDGNGNGLIDDAGEMFGGAARGAGFLALSAYDTNSDGAVTADDVGFSSLQLWKDSDQDGDTDSGELLTLSAAGVTRLDLNYSVIDQWDNGNLIGEVSTATVGGIERSMADIYFRYDATPQIIGNKAVAISDGTAFTLALLAENPDIDILDANLHRGVFFAGSQGSDYVDVSELQMDGLKEIRTFDGDDEVIGNNAPNIIIAGMGADTITGGDGADLFRYENLQESSLFFGKDRIEDFDYNEGDRISISDAGIFGSFIGNLMFSGGVPQIRAQINGDGDTEIEASTSGDLTEFSLILAGQHSVTIDYFI